jgi:hypothetical protein
MRYLARCHIPSFCSWVQIWVQFSLCCPREDVLFEFQDGQAH